MERLSIKLSVAALVLASVGVAFWLGRRDAAPAPEEITSQPASETSEPTPPRASWSKPAPAQPSAPEAAENETAAASGYPRGAVKGEVILQFDDAASMQEAVRRLTAEGVALRGSIRSLNMLRVAVPNGEPPSALGKFLDGIKARTSFNRPVDVPQPIDLPENARLRPFGEDWLQAIGVTEDNSDWGAGVRVAVIDSGVTRHPALDGARINRIAMVDGAVQSGHGNAVTSVIVGNGEPGHPRGLAPAAEVLAYQALAGEGGEAFTVAESIVDAADRGASIINLSLGAFGDSPAVEQAVRYAQNAGAVVVAAVGNERQDRIYYPAAYEGVIAVTAVDADFNWAQYPNAGIEGKTPNIAGPGVGVPAAFADDQNIAFSGTSTAAPAITAAIAADMSLTGASAQASAARVLANANDRGEPGADPFLGDGYLDMGRVIRANQPGVFDLAISDHYTNPAEATEAGLPVRIGVQNRGTETVRQPVLTVMVGNRANQQQIPLPPLAPGETAEFEAFLPAEHFFRKGGAALGAAIHTNEGEDINNANNALASQYTLPGR